MQKYLVSEIFDSIQGEGSWTGLPVTFVRFSGCNMACEFCDTDHSQHTEMSALDIALRCRHADRVVFTGGEPLLQDLVTIMKMMPVRSFGIETNGTKPIPHGLSAFSVSISLSPKVPREKLALGECDSLKLLYPYLPEIFAEDFLTFPASYRSLQPVEREGVMPIQETINEVKRLGGNWRLGVQLHKLLGVK